MVRKDSGLCRAVARVAANDLDFLFKRQPVKTGEWQVYKHTDALAEQPEGMADRLAGGLLTLGGGRIFQPPMCSHRPARPDGTHFARRAVADSKHKIERRCARLGKLVPALA